MWRIFPVLLIGVVTSAPFVAAAEPLADRVAGLTRSFKGTVGLYAKNLSTGQEFGVAPDTRVRTASTIKLPILCALESLVAAGKVKWDERIILKPEDKVSGSGVLASLENHTELTVRTLAILMIVLSDGRPVALHHRRGSTERPQAAGAVSTRPACPTARSRRRSAESPTAPGFAIGRPAGSSRSGSLVGSVCV